LSASTPTRPGFVLPKTSLSLSLSLSLEKSAKSAFGVRVLIFTALSAPDWCFIRWNFPLLGEQRPTGADFVSLWCWPDICFLQVAGVFGTNEVP